MRNPGQLWASFGPFTIGDLGAFGGNPFCGNSWRYRPDLGPISVWSRRLRRRDQAEIGPISPRISTEQIPTERTYSPRFTTPRYMMFGSDRSPKNWFGGAPGSWPRVSPGFPVPAPDPPRVGNKTFPIGSVSSVLVLWDSILTEPRAKTENERTPNGGGRGGREEGVITHLSQALRISISFESWALVFFSSSS